MRAAAVLAPPERRENVRRIWSSSRWTAYFHRNSDNLLSIPWERGAELRGHERDAIAASLQVFQQGEAQEGRHFFRVAREYAEQWGDTDYVAAHRIFMAEERRHGRDLGRFLERAGVPCLVKQSWFAQAFCWCGSRGRLETTLRIILMSEIIAQVYYAAIRAATGSPVLRRLCPDPPRREGPCPFPVRTPRADSLEARPLAAAPRSPVRRRCYSSVRDSLAGADTGGRCGRAAALFSLTGARRSARRRSRGSRKPHILTYGIANKGGTGHGQGMVAARDARRPEARRVAADGASAAALRPVAQSVLSEGPARQLRQARADAEPGADQHRRRRRRPIGRCATGTKTCSRGRRRGSRSRRWSASPST